MMRRIELLPPSHLERLRRRRNLGVIVVVGVLLVLLMVGWWLLLGMSINDERDELAQIQARNADLQAQIAELQRFAELENEVRTKEEALATVMAGDVDWPAVLTEIAMVLPGEIWLTQLNGSAQAEGATAVGTEGAPVRISEEQPFGRIQFSGRSLSMPGVAKWLVRLASVREFNALWLNNATMGEATEGGVDVVDFDSTLELADDSASARFQGETP